MAMELSKVVVIQDASSRDVYATEIKRAFKEMSLQPGDEIMFLAILDRFSSPSMFLPLIVLLTLI